METVAPTAQDACENRGVCSCRRTSRTNDVCSMDQRFLLKRMLRRCKWIPLEQRLRIQNRYCNKNLEQVKTIVGMDLESLNPDEQQTYGRQAFRLNHFHEMEFPGYKHRLMIKPRACFCHKCPNSAKHIEPAKHQSTCKPHQKVKANPEDELLQARPPMLAIQTASKEPNLVNEMQERVSQLRVPLEHQYDKIDSAKCSKIYSNFVARMNPNLVTEMQERVSQYNIHCRASKMETVAPTAQDACENRGVRSCRRTSRTNDVCSMDQRFLLKRMLRRCKWIPLEQRLRIQNRYCNKNLEQVKMIVGKDLESLNPDEQQTYGRQAFRLKHFHEMEFPGYKHRLMMKPRTCFCHKCPNSAKHIEPAKHQSTCKPHQKVKANPEDELLQARPPMLAIQTASKELNLVTEMQERVSQLRVPLEHQYDKIDSAKYSKIYSNFVARMNPNLVTEMQERVSQLRVPLEHQYDKLD